MVRFGEYAKTHKSSILAAIDTSKHKNIRMAYLTKIFCDDRLGCDIMMEFLNRHEKKESSELKNLWGVWAYLFAYFGTQEFSW